MLIPSCMKIHFMAKSLSAKPIIVPGYYWVGAGLVWHKSINGKGYTISHKEGAYVLTNIPKNKIYQYMMKLAKLTDWHKSEKELKRDKMLKVKVRKLRREVG